MRDIEASVREADAQARREFDAMRSATKAVAAEATEAVDAPPAVTPTDRRDTPGYEPEPDDASGQVPDDRACRRRRGQPARPLGRTALPAAARHRPRGGRPARPAPVHHPAVHVAGAASALDNGTASCRHSSRPP